MPRLGELDLERHLRDPALKQHFVTPMFDIIAPRYDRFTRIFSFGMDRGWKRSMLREAERHLSASPVILDVACGTGDLALALAQRARGGQVLGVDASPRMIEMAQTRQAGGLPVRFAVGDMTRLDLPAASVDLVTAGYGLRNVPDHRAALSELARVTRPGGRLLTLDFYRPPNGIWRRLFLAYLAAAGNSVGWLWHREPVVYGYIARSIDHFVSWTRFSSDLEAAGFRVERVDRKLFGGIALHFAVRR